MYQIKKYNSNIILEINIKIGRDFKKTLSHILGQDPVLAASLFCEQNNLKPSAVYYIQQAIEQVINNVNDIENSCNQQQNQADNFYEECDPRHSWEYQNQRERAAPLRQNQQNQKQFQVNQFNQTTKMNNNQKCNIKNDQEKNYRVEYNHINNVYNPGIRLYQKGQTQNQIKEKKILQMRRQQEEQHLKEATFSPSLNFNSLLISEKQDQNERIERMKKKKEEKINQIKLNSLVKEQEKCTFQPQIGIVNSFIFHAIKLIHILINIIYIFQKKYVLIIKQKFQNWLVYQRSQRSLRSILAFILRFIQKIGRNKLKKIRKNCQISLSESQIQFYILYSLEEQNKLECTFTPDLYSNNKSFDITHTLDKKQLDITPEKVFDLNKSIRSSLNSSQISSVSTREGLIVNHPKIKTPLCNYPIENKEQKQFQNQSKSQGQKSFFNLENKFQQMKLQRLASPKKQQIPEEKPTVKKIKRSNSLNVWHNLYQQAVQQKENQKEFEYKIKQTIQQEVNKQKMSLKSQELINQQRNQIIECIFEVLDGDKKGYINPDNLHSQYLTANLNKILKPLYDAIIMNNTTLDSDQFKKAVKTLYNTIHFDDKLVISRILQKRSSSLPNDKKDISQTNIKSSCNSCKEPNYVCKRCKICQDTLNILGEMDEIKSNYVSINKYEDQSIKS